jgi:hypothetical protein
MGAYGITIFSDDLRHEIGGKITCVGIYRGTLIHRAEFPVILPKLAMLIMYREQAQTLSGDLIIRAYFPGDADESPTFEVTIPMDELRAKSVKPDPMPQDGEWAHNIEIPIVISPVVIKEEGWIRVRAYCGKEVFKLGTLRVVKVSSDLPAPPNIAASNPDISPGSAAG